MPTFVIKYWPSNDPVIINLPRIFLTNKTLSVIEVRYSHGCAICCSCKNPHFRKRLFS